MLTICVVWLLRLKWWIFFKASGVVPLYDQMLYKKFTIVTCLSLWIISCPNGQQCEQAGLQLQLTYNLTTLGDEVAFWKPVGVGVTFTKIVCACACRNLNNFGAGQYSEGLYFPNFFILKGFYSEWWLFWKVLSWRVIILEIFIPKGRCSKIQNDHDPSG